MLQSQRGLSLENSGAREPFRCPKLRQGGAWPWVHGPALGTASERFLWLRGLHGKGCSYEWSEAVTQQQGESASILGGSGRLTLAPLVHLWQREITQGPCYRLSLPPHRVEGPQPHRGPGPPAGTATTIAVQG